MNQVPEPQSPIVFIDDAHTFGGTQVALAWIIHALLGGTNVPVICVCTKRTRLAVEEVNGPNSRLTFVQAPSALPLNILSFPLRLFAYIKLLQRIRTQPVQAWWLNLADIEFCLAPLVVLRAYGETTHSYLHGTACFAAFYKHAPLPRRALSRFRDVLANTFAYRLHHLLVTPSQASRKEVQARIGPSGKPPVDYLYYPIERHASHMEVPSVLPREPGHTSVDLWMIGGIVFGHKNNLAALDVLELLLEQGCEATLTLAGTGPDMKRFQQEAADRALSTHITYLGWVTDPCDHAPKDAIVFIPSFHETMNLVAREAMRNGLRIVASPIPVFLEWIPDHFIAADFSREAFCTALGKVCALPADEIASSYTAALSKFSNEAFVEGFSRLTRI